MSTLGDAMPKPVACGVLLWCTVWAVAASAVAHSASCEKNGVRCVSGGGYVRDSILGLTEVVWVGPESKQIYVGSPSLWKMPNSGEIVGSHDFFGATTLNSTVQVLVEPSGAGDGGAAWQHAGNVSGVYWANLFTHPAPSRAAELYLLGVSGDDRAKVRDIVIARSDDLGRTWTPPAVLFAGSAGRSYHCAPTPTLVAADGRLYRAFETYSKYSGAFLISTAAAATTDTNLLAPGSWVQSSTVVLHSGSARVPATWDPAGHFNWQEGNAVALHNGSVYNMLRIDGQTNATHNKAAVLRLESPTPAPANAAPANDATNAAPNAAPSLVFDRMIDFPATSSKFVVRADPQSKSLLSLSTDVSPEAVAIGAVGARNHLSLVVSKAGSIHEWEACAVLLVDDTGVYSL